MLTGSAQQPSDDNLTFLEPSPRASETTDRELAHEVTAAAHRLQEAMDKAILAGLIVEPSFMSVDNRFSAVGVSAQSFLVKIKILRRLS